MIKAMSDAGMGVESMMNELGNARASAFDTASGGVGVRRERRPSSLAGRGPSMSIDQARIYDGCQPPSTPVN